MSFPRRTSLTLVLAALAACSSNSSSNNTSTSKGPKPEIASITPGLSLLEGGGYVLVKGLGFKTGLTLTVGGAAVAPAAVFFVDRETFSFKVPPGKAPGAADVVVRNTDSDPTTFAQGIDYEASTLPAPAISKVTPNSGPVTGDTYAILAGQNFAAGAIVLVGGAPASIVNVITPGQITARLPPTPTAAGTANLVVTNPDGQSAVLGDGFAYADLGSSVGPKLSSAVPDEGPLAGGNQVLIKADGVGPGALFFVGGLPTDLAAATGGFSAVMPPAAKHGLVDLAITNANGQSDLLAGAYNYIQTKLVVPPVIARVTPDQAPPAGGGRVVVEGEGFQAGAQVLFGDAPCGDAVVTPPRALTCVVPPGKAGTVDVTVQNDDGGVAKFGNGFTYVASTRAAPSVTTVSPNTGPATGGTVAAVAGSGFASGAVVIVGGRPAGSVVLNDQNLLTARFPALAPGAADVTVTNDDGQSGTLKSGFTVAAQVGAAPPRINTITPSAGPLEGGVGAIIAGDGFSSGAKVFVGGRPAAAAAQPGLIVVTVPPGADVGLADVAVTNNDGQSDVLPGGFNYFNGPPVLTGIVPQCGPAGGNTQVTISGRNFKAGVSATIGGKPLSGFTRPDTATIQGTTTQSPAGFADVVVTNADGQVDTLSGGYTFTDGSHPCPTSSGGVFVLTRVVPNSGPNLGGTVITLVGQGFVTGAQVKFGDAVATDLKLLGGGALTVTLPASTKLGPVDVSVGLADGRLSKLSGAFNYFDPTSNLPAPQVSAVSPNAGPNTGASVVQVSGANFVTGARVFFGPTEASLPTLVDSTRLIAVTPNSLPGPVDVTVLNPDGKSGTLAFGFAFYPVGAAGAPPSATRVDPRTGSTLTPSAVSVKGSGFQPGALVFLGTQPATNVQLQGDGSLAVTVAPQAPGTVDVIVTNPDGQSSTISGGFTFAAPAPKLTAIAPASGPLAGGITTVISGSGFAAGDLIAFGGTIAPVKVLDDTAIFATVPAHDAGIVDVTLVRGAVTVDTLAASFTYDPSYQVTPPPAIASLEPATGPLSGGTVLWLTGSNIGAGAKIYFGASLASKVVRADAGHLVVTAPPGSAPGFVDVNIVNADGQAGALLRAFSYVPDALLSGLAPKLTSVTPDKGPESTDTTAILTGRNFVTGELVFVGAARGAGVRLLSSSIITNTFPHQPAAQVDVAITHPDGRSSVLPGGFTFLARPTLVSVGNTSNPAAGNIGPTVGGTQVTIAGTGFQLGATLTFGRVPATSVVVKSDTILTAVTPGGTAGPADVQLINPDGQTAVLTGGWLYVSPPKATGLQPPTGPVGGGTYAILAGTDFSPGAVVTVGGVPASTVFSSTASLLVITPAGAAGPADVVVKNPDGQTSTLTGGFTYSAGPFGAAPALAGIVPATGPDNGGTFVQLTGSNFARAAIGIVGGAGLARNFVVNGGTLTGLTGPGPTAAPVVVAVTNPDGLSAHLDGAFTYRDHTTLGLPPVVDHAFPAQALAPGGTAINVLGSNFSTGQAPLVFMQGLPSGVTAGGNDKTLNVTTPAAQPGPADIAVVNPDGQTSIKANAFTFLVPPPQFDGTTPLCVLQPDGSCSTPAKGPTAGGTKVRVNGSYFQPPVQVYFGNSLGAVDPDPAKTNATQITVTTPGGPAGYVGVRIVNQDSQSAPVPGAPGAPQFYYQSPPILTQVQPTSGVPGGGETITLRGQYFSGDATTIKVRFGNSGPLTIIGTPTANTIQVRSPPQGSGGAVVAILITNDDGQTSLYPGAFIYLPPPAPPTLTAVTPSAGPQSGGTAVTVLGQHFQYGASVSFGAVPAGPGACTVISDSAISCLTPNSGVLGPVPIKVTNPDTTDSTAGPVVNFTYLNGPSPTALKIFTLSPTQGITTGGTQLVIAGTGFPSLPTVTFIAATGCPNGQTCEYPLNNVQPLGPTAILATTPPQPLAGASAYHLKVASSNGSDTLLNAWTYGNGIRRFVPYGLRMPMESNAGKYNRGTDSSSLSNNLTMPSWMGTVGDFTHPTGTPLIADVFIGGNGNRNPRLYQGTVDPTLGSTAKPRVFTDVTATSLRNPDGTPVRDNSCCGYNGTYAYQVFQPRTLDMNGDGLQDVVFWNDSYPNFGFNIFFNNAPGAQTGPGILTAAFYNQPWGYNVNATDWVGQDWQGKPLDFNLDGAPDLLAVAAGQPPTVLLSCGGTATVSSATVPKPASPYCNLGSTRPNITIAVSPGSPTIAGNQTASFASTAFAAFMTVGSRWIVDSGPNTEVVTINSSVSGASAALSNFNATFTLAHVAGTVLSPIIQTTAHSVSGSAIAANTDVLTSVDDRTGFGLNDLYLVADLGFASQEVVHVTAAANGSGQLTLHYNQAHAKDLTLTTRNPNGFVFDNSRFLGQNGAVNPITAYTVVASDIDGDGDVDVIAGTTSSNPGGLVAFLNNAHQLANANKDPAGFALSTSSSINQQTFPGGVINGNVRALAMFDVNADNKPDLLVGYRDNQPEKLFINGGNGIFVDEASGFTPNPGATPPKLACADGSNHRLPANLLDSVVRYDIQDFDGVNGPDVLAWIQVSGAAGTFRKPLRLWLNDGHGCFFGQPTDLTTGGITDTLLPPADGILQTWAYAIGDYNKDGLPDMIAGIEGAQSREYVNFGGTFADKTVSNLPLATQTPANNSTVWWKYTLGTVLADLDGDGFPDLLTSQFNRDQNLNYANGQTCNYYTPSVCDPDGTIRLYRNDQTGNFPSDDTLTRLPNAVVGGKIVSALPIASYGMDVARLSANGPQAVIISSATNYLNGIPSVLAGTPFYNQVGATRLLINNGSGTFTDVTYPSLPTNGQIFGYYFAVKFVDLDGDGYQDIVIGDMFDGQIHVWQGTPGGYFIDVTGTALPTGLPNNSYNNVSKILAANLDGDNLDRPDLLVMRNNQMRLLINHSNDAGHPGIYLVDETAAPFNRIATLPSGFAAVIGQFSPGCSGGLDIYYLDNNGGEHVLFNGDCTTPQSCGFFSDATSNSGVMADPSAGRNCIGTDCGGNSGLVGLNFSTANTDLVVLRNSDGYNTVRPHRILQNNCGSFTDVTRNASAMPFDNDPVVGEGWQLGSGIVTGGIYAADIFGHALQQPPDGNGTVRDLMIMTLYGPRVYRNSP